MKIERLVKNDKKPDHKFEGIVKYHYKGNRRW